MTPSAPSTAPSPGWWGRNWKWFVPLLACSLAAAVLAAIAAFVWGVMALLKSSDVSQLALQEARQSQEVAAELGTPLVDGWYMTGNIHINGPAGKADIALPVSGPKGKGTVYAVAVRSAGQWEFKKLVVEINATGRRINLLAPPEPAGNAP